MGLIVVIALVAAIAFWPQAHGSQLSVEAGSTIVRGETPSIALNLRWPDAGPRASDYECGAWFNGVAHFRGEEQRANFAWRCMLVGGYRRIELGFGPAYLLNTDEFNSSNMNFALLLRCRLSERWYLTIDEHASNGSGRRKNRGRDMTRIGFVVALDRL